MGLNPGREFVFWSEDAKGARKMLKLVADKMVGEVISTPQLGCIPCWLLRVEGNKTRAAIHVRTLDCLDGEVYLGDDGTPLLLSVAVVSRIKTTLQLRHRKFLESVIKAGCRCDGMNDAYCHELLKAIDADVEAGCKEQNARIDSKSMWVVRETEFAGTFCKKCDRDPFMPCINFVCNYRGVGLTFEHCVEGEPVGPRPVNWVRPELFREDKS